MTASILQRARRTLAGNVLADQRLGPVDTVQMFWKKSRSGFEASGLPRPPSAPWPKPHILWLQSLRRTQNAGKVLRRRIGLHLGSFRFSWERELWLPQLWVQCSHL